MCDNCYWNIHHNRLRKAWAGLRESQVGILPPTCKEKWKIIIFIIILWQPAWIAISKTYRLHFIVTIY